MVKLTDQKNGNCIMLEFKILGKFCILFFHGLEYKYDILQPKYDSTNNVQSRELLHDFKWQN